MAEVKEIRPQKGFQEKFLSSNADIVIGGSGAGVGKSFALLLEFLRNKNVKGFNAVFFRRTYEEINQSGGLWDESTELYPYAGGIPTATKHRWSFRDKYNTEISKFKFAHLEHEKDKKKYQGGQIAYLAFDELTHFSETMFFYLMTRNRSKCGVKPFIRATCNPDPDSWVAKFIEWWIDQDTGFAIPERDGILRYFIKWNKDYVWGDSKQEVIEKSGHIIDKILEANPEAKPEDLIKSVTFISGKISDNKKLLEVDPSYLANLLSQPEEVRRSLLESNWKHVENENEIFNFKAFSGMFSNVFNVRTGKKYITADIAGQGSNKFVVGVWDGKELIDLLVMAKSNGREVIDGIRQMAMNHKVPNHRIIFDADGIGGLVDGFFEGAIPFSGGSAPIPVVDPLTGMVIKENYFNLKNQLIFRAGKAVNNNEYKISDEVHYSMFDKQMTVKERFIFERKAFKKDKPDVDRKMRAIPKEQMKVILQNESPDLMDMFTMREYFDLIDDDFDVQATEHND